MLHRFGPFELDELRFELRRHGKPIVVQRQVLETITFLVKNPDRLVSKDELIGGPWKGTAVSDAALAHVIMVARRALADRGKGAPHIETVRGKGYRFVADVTTHIPNRSSSADSRPPSTEAPRPQSPEKDVLLGRKNEVDVLLAAAERATDGHGNLLLVGGEPGIGKTSLLEHFARSVPNMEVLWGRCWEAGGAPAFWPWLEIIRAYVDHHGDEAIAMMDTGASDIARWLPELRDSTSAAQTPPLDPDSPQARFRTFDSVTRFICRAAREHPLVLIIDDLHAADDASVLLLDFMTRALEGARVLLVASFRDLEVRSKPVLAAFLGGPSAHAQPVTLSGITENDVAILLGRSTNHELPTELVRRVFKATNGNPFLVQEVGRTVLASVTDGRLDVSRLESFRIPDRVADIVRRHLKHLPSSTITALATASVIGREFDLPLLHDLCGSDPDRGVGDLEPALVEGVIKESTAAPGVFSFSHTLIRDTLYHELPPTRRLALHYSTAELLERQRASDYAIAFQIAHHYFAAAAHKGADKALEWSLKAAQRARGLFAYELAVEHFRRALRALELVGRSETKVCEILLLLADAQRLSGHASEAIATFQEAENLARSRGLGAVAAKALLGCADVMRDGAGMDETIHMRMQEALNTLPELDSPLRARLLAALSFASFLSRPLSEREAICNDAIAMAKRLGDPITLASVLWWSHWTTSETGGLSRALEVATEMAEVAQLAGDGERLLDAHLWRLTHLLSLGYAEEIDIAATRHASMAARFRHPVHTWWAKVVASTRAFIEGQLLAAQTLAKEAFDLGFPTQELIAEGVFGAQMLLIALEKDGDDRTRGLEQVTQIAKKFVQAVPSYRPWRAALALLEMEAGATSEARVGLEKFASEGFDKIPHDPLRLWILAALSRLACSLEDAPRAKNLYMEWCRHAGTHVISGGIGYWGPASLYLGMTAATMGETDLAATHFDKAAIESANLGSPPWRAWAEFEFGVILTKRKNALDQRRGADLIRSALATSRRLGLTRLEKRIKAAVREAR